MLGLEKLPRDVIFHIISYTYNVQQKPLLHDITHYNRSKKLLLDLYYNYWIVILQSSDVDDDKNWLINDIFAYANTYKPTMYGYVDKFYEIFRRNCRLQTNHEVDNYVRLLQQKNVLSQINIFLGLLTPPEREDIIRFQIINENLDKFNHIR